MFFSGNNTIYIIKGQLSDEEFDNFHNNEKEEIKSKIIQMIQDNEVRVHYGSEPASQVLDDENQKAQLIEAIPKLLPQTLLFLQDKQGFDGIEHYFSVRVSERQLAELES